MTPRRLTTNGHVRLVVGAAALTLGAAAVVVAAQADPTKVISPASEAAQVADSSAQTTELSNLGQAPLLDTSAGWLDDRATDVRARVVLYELWTFGCSNCKHTLPYIRALYDRYERDGLTIVGIHTPEFDYESEPARISEAARELGVTWPVLLDPDKKNWRAFANRYWPRVFIADVSGEIRFDHIGEGAYGAMEDAIRALLHLDALAPRAEFPQS